MNTIRFIVIYLIIINVIGFFLMGIDKGKARRKAWRIPEATLFTTGLLGGCPGVIIGMYVFHHKTKKPRFFIGLPVILGIQILAIIILSRSGLVFHFM